MNIWYENAESTVDTPGDLQPIVDAALAAGVGSIMLWSADAEYPQIQAFVCDSLGYLFYQPNAESAGHVATGLPPDGCPETVLFQLCKDASADDIDAPSDLVIPAEAACTALFEFLEKGVRPHSTDWLEL